MITKIKLKPHMYSFPYLEEDNPLSVITNQFVEVNIYAHNGKNDWKGWWLINQGSCENNYYQFSIKSKKSAEYILNIPGEFVEFENEEDKDRVIKESLIRNIVE